MHVLLLTVTTRAARASLVSNTLLSRERTADSGELLNREATRDSGNLYVVVVGSCDAEEVEGSCEATRDAGGGEDGGGVGGGDAGGEGGRDGGGGGSTSTRFACRSAGESSAGESAAGELPAHRFQMSPTTAKPLDVNHAASSMLSATQRHSQEPTDRADILESAR